MVPCATQDCSHAALTRLWAPMLRPLLVPLPQLPLWPSKKRLGDLVRGKGGGVGRCRCSAHLVMQGIGGGGIGGEISQGEGAGGWMGWHAVPGEE